MVYFAVGALRAATDSAEGDSARAGMTWVSCWGVAPPNPDKMAGCWRNGAAQVWVLDQIFGTFYVHVPIRATVLKVHGST